MKLNRTMMLCLCIVLAVAMATTGTIAYLQDSASDVNVMTMGNVKIEQIEQERDENGDLTDFTQGKPAMPAVGPIEWADEHLVVGDHEVKVFTEDLKNVIDKIVTVKNTGRSDAYIRTIIAIEAPNGDPNDLLHVNYNHVDYVQDPSWTLITLDGVEYVYTCYTYQDILAPGEVSAPSLIQLFLDAKATNEDIEAFGEEWEVIVLSQAVQAAGFDGAATALNEAFGEANEQNVTEWMGGAKKSTVASADDLSDALADANYGSTITLGADIAVSDPIDAIDGKLTIDLGGNELSTQQSSGHKALNNAGELEIKNGDLKVGSSADYGVISRAGSETTITDVNIVSAGGGVAAVDGAEVTFNGGSLAVNSASTSGRYLFYAEGEGSVITINGGDFSFSKTLNQKRAYVYAGDGTAVYVTGGNFGPASTRDGYTAGFMGTGEIIVSGGTFGFDPSAWVADGYEAVKDGSTWTVKAK